MSTPFVTVDRDTPLLLPCDLRDWVPENNLIYCYANGVFGSRRIGRATHRDIAVHCLTGDAHLDHDTMAKFQLENFEAVAACFVRVQVT